MPYQSSERKAVLQNQKKAVGLCFPKQSNLARLLSIFILYLLILNLLWLA
ncbi:unnamed protein product [Linum tenue]|uniref:Uncharacterized protein n=1 Tax=Linum tenue TaxID=586396 RepID=A0AAV0L8H0_9ROSI|nr:unnamed protein product [Linum tenue]